MKKSLVALAVLAAAGAASAQSSVTLFGIVDAGITYNSVKSTVTSGAVSSSVKSSSWAMTNSGLSSSRLGFRGTEDLGGGLAASFWIEAGLQNDQGTAGGTVGTGGTASTTGLFNRRSTVSLSGGFGEIRLGRDYNATFSNDSAFDPFGTNGVGTNLILLSSPMPTLFQVRNSNMIGYFLPPNIGGVYGQLQYSLHENIDTGASGSPLTSGRYVGGRIGWANGPLDLALAYGQQTVADSLVLGASKVKPLNFGISYDLGVVKLFGELSRVEVTTGGSAIEPSTDGALFGITAPIGAGLIRASVAAIRVDDDVAGTSDLRAQKYSIGYVHNLSKRTALYTTYAHTRSKIGTSLANLRVRGNAWEAGLRHSF